MDGKEPNNNQPDSFSPSGTEIEENGQHGEPGTGATNGAARDPGVTQSDKPISIQGHIGTITIIQSQTEVTGGNEGPVGAATQQDTSSAQGASGTHTIKHAETAINICGSVNTLNIYTHNHPVHLHIHGSIDSGNLLNSQSGDRAGGSGHVEQGNIQQLVTEQAAVVRRLEKAMQDILRRLQGSNVRDSGVDEEDDVRRSRPASGTFADNERSSDDSGADNPREPIRRCRSVRDQHNHSGLPAQRSESSDGGADGPHTVVTGAGAKKGGRGSGTETLTTTDEEQKRRNVKHEKDSNLAKKTEQKELLNPPLHVDTDIEETLPQPDAIANRSDVSEHNEESGMDDLGDLNAT